MTRSVLEFINIPLVNGFPPSDLRRKVRSHAAKATRGVDGDGTPDKNEKVKGVLASHQTPQFKKRKRHRRTLNWTFQMTAKIDEPQSELELEHENADSGFRVRNGAPGCPSPSSISGTALIPASKSRVYFEPFVPVVLQHYLQHLAVAIPEVDGEGNTALLKSRWFPMVIHSPLLFQVIVLFSASHYAAQREDMAFAPTILLLKQRALAGISAHVTALQRECTVRDELIAATAKMASYEAIWGDERAYHCHMNGVEEMLRVRGGLASLGLDGFLARLLLFIDTNSAFLLNTFLHLRNSSFPRGEPFILPNLSRFIGEI
ncbi:hypothetical protein PV08_00557 [Exophiala spinifera]|uniref:Uncharacterized protein n=1 Tax=Exophiala spinifera TaxID=91928 RepID=A0A0D2A5E4_9EURO|nr:uncharacterized protein PV08_00557 [Exophiala spinifera]KIW19982.1 hypothetical protein PV08_00557 [Exophiala spinifera]